MLGSAWRPRIRAVVMHRSAQSWFSRMQRTSRFGSSSALHASAHELHAAAQSRHARRHAISATSSKAAPRGCAWIICWPWSLLVSGMGSSSVCNCDHKAAREVPSGVISRVTRYVRDCSSWGRYVRAALTCTTGTVPVAACGHALATRQHARRSTRPRGSDVARSLLGQRRRVGAAPQRGRAWRADQFRASAAGGSYPRALGHCGRNGRRPRPSRVTRPVTR